MAHHFVNQEYTQSNGLKVVLQQLSEANESELVEQIFALSDRPEVLGLLIYKLMSERKHTNEILEDINKKYDSLMTLYEQNPVGRKGSYLNNEVSGVEEIVDIESLFLTEQDKFILRLARSQKWVSAKDVKKEIGYKGLNAASQRLNKLAREGYLDKNRVGQQVAFVLNKKYK